MQRADSCLRPGGGGGCSTLRRTLLNKNLCVACAYLRVEVVDCPLHGGDLLL